MDLDYEKKTAFMIDGLGYCYKVMPFGLKNVWATYRRLMDKIFADQISKNVEVYVDDMMGKIPALGDHCKDLEEIFAQIKKRNMRLNPEKCAFGVKAEIFLSFMIAR